MNKTIYRVLGIVMVLALTFGGFVNTQALSNSLVLQTPGARMLIPLYIYPSGSAWADVVNANVYGNIDVIINPSNGVGTTKNGAYVNGVNQLRAGNVGIYGYVYTDRGIRLSTTVKAEIDNWQLWYGVDGIFLDEASVSTSNLFYYSDLWTYITAKGMRVILNPGTNTDEAYTSVSNSIVIYENIPSQTLSVPSWVANYPASKFASMQHQASVDQMRDFVTLAKANNIGNIYVTNDVLPNPWDQLPPYLAEEAALIAGGSVPPTLTMPPLPVTQSSTSTFTPSITPTIIPTFTPPLTFTSTSTVTGTATPTIVPVGQNIVEVRVVNGTDDVEESSTGSMSLNSSDLELIYDASNQVVGIRFLSVNVPRGATITNAYIQFKADETSSDITNLFIQGEASSSALAFASTSRNVSSRSRTINTVSWSPPSWLTVGATGTGQRTPNLAPVIQEIASQTGWTAGNSLVIIITGSGRRVAEAYEGDPAGAPLLHIEYTTPASPTITPVLTATTTTSRTATPTNTATVVSPTRTNSPTSTKTPTPTTTPIQYTSTYTPTSIPTTTVSKTSTPTNTTIRTPTYSPTSTPTATASKTSTPTNTTIRTPTYTPTSAQTVMVITSVRDMTSPNLVNVKFIVTFSESVTGVDVSDFRLTTTGVSGATVSGVIGSGSVYTITVNTGTGNGAIRLDVVDDNSIVNAESNPLGGPAVGDGNFTAGEIYTINKPLVAVFITDTWAVQVSRAADPNQLALQLGAQNLGQIGTLSGYYLFRIPGSDTQPKTATDLFSSNSQVLWFEQQMAHQLSTRDYPNQDGNLADVMTATATMDDAKFQDNADNVSSIITPSATLLPEPTQTAITIMQSSPAPSQSFITGSVPTQTTALLIQASPIPTQTPIVQIQPSSMPTTSVQSAKTAALRNEPLLIPTTMIQSTIPFMDSENTPGNGSTILAVVVMASVATGGVFFSMRRKINSAGKSSKLK